MNLNIIIIIVIIIVLVLYCALFVCLCIWHNFLIYIIVYYYFNWKNFTLRRN